MEDRGNDDPGLLDLAASFVTALPDPAVLVDASFAVVCHNQLYADLTGLKRRELAAAISSGQTAFELIGQSKDEDEKNARTSLSLMRTVHLAEVSVENSAGERFVMMQTFIPVRNREGRGAGVIEILRDVSAEARIHAQYKEMVERERARADELERVVEERTKQLKSALDEVTRLSRIDPLTGVLNRRAFGDYADQALKLAARHQRTIALLMCDLDFFKRVNDTFGHQVGDDVLIDVANGLVQMVRETDKVARFGGEEFVVLLVDTTPDAVLMVAERCSQMVRSLPPPEGAGDDWIQTISIGAAVFPRHGRTLEEMIGSSDRALYHAKETGRDRVVVCDEVPKEDLAPAARPAETRRGLRVLIVDPQRDRAETVVRSLPEQFDATCVGSIDEALTACRSTDFEAIVADRSLDEGRGEAFLRRTIALLPNVLRVLVLTSLREFLELTDRSARVDCFLLWEDIDELALAIDDGLLRRDLARAGVLVESERQRATRDRLSRGLREVLDARSIHVVYQPIFAVEGAAPIGEAPPIGYEAFCRASHPAFSDVRILFETAFREGRLWEVERLVRGQIARDLDRIDPTARVFINLHPSDLADPMLLDPEILGRWADRVVCEISEPVSLPQLSELVEGAKQLRDAGIQIAVDDLGAGYGSLSIVSLIEPAFIKIERSVTAGLERSATKREIVRNIVSYARPMEIAVVVTGIESEGQARMARELGCGFVQGYHFGRPAPLGK